MSFSPDPGGDGTETVCVHGLGYIGLPTGAMLANSGYEVRGFDADPAVRDRLRAGELRFEEADLERFVRRALSEGLTIVDEIPAAEYHLVCVPTPLEESRERIDLQHVQAAGEAIATELRRGDTVVLESTVPPGTTVHLLAPALADSGYRAGGDYTLAYSPETALRGDTLTEMRTNARIVGGVGPSDISDVVSLFGTFVQGNIRTTDATTAEFVKLIQNAYRDVNIAFANEIAKLAHEFDIDSRAAIELANDHPRVDVLRPGPGVGGHSLPISPLFLDEGEHSPRLIRTANEVNDGMVDFVTELLTAAMTDLERTSIGLLGVAYKGGVGDTRESPTLRLVERLEAAGAADIRMTDPYVDSEQIDRDVLRLEGTILDVDAAVLVTDHPEYGALSPELFADLMRGETVVDTRAMLDVDRWEAAGLDVYQI